MTILKCDMEHGTINLMGYSNRTTLKAAIRDLAKWLRDKAPAASAHIESLLDDYVYIVKNNVTWASNAHFVKVSKSYGCPEGSKWFIEFIELQWVK